MEDSGKISQARNQSPTISSATGCEGRPVTSITFTPDSFRIHVSWRRA
jgi:hypothetical protein